MTHKTKINVRYAETDMMGVVHHSNYAVWAEYARTEMLKDMGNPYLQMEKDGIMLPVTELYFQYKAPTYFDDSIIIESAVVHMDNRRLKVVYKIFRNEIELCAVGYTKHIYMGVESRRSVRVDDNSLQGYKKYFVPYFENNK